MDYEFLSGFTPRILDVVKRDKPFWESFPYVLERAETKLHILAYVVSGTGTMEWGRQPIQARISPGSIFQVVPGNYMKITTSPQDTLIFYSIHFQYGLIRWNGKQAHWQENKTKLPFAEIIRRPENPLLQDQFAEAYTLWNEKKNGYEWFVKTRFLHILQLLSSPEYTSNEGDPPSIAAVENAIEYMKACYGNVITRDTLAGHVSLSPGYFSMAFKKYTGLSPIQYLNKIRLDRAKQLLKGTRLSIGQIAGEVGFADSFYFTRLFTRETGISPRDYRNA